jgi:hypothetical protein
MRAGDRRATDAQLELLATIETDCELDDLLDEELSQGEVLRRLREALGQSPVPREVVERVRGWREERAHAPACRMCGKIGDSTKHHFINKWMLKELSNYAQRWSNRRENCIPLCIDCHAGIHMRDDRPKSIVHLLTSEERAFAEAALSALAEEHPKIVILLARGDSGVYQTQLVRDWMDGRFREAGSFVVARAA